MKKPIPTFNIQLSDMFTECRNKNKAKVKRWKFKQWLLKKAEREEREANIQRVDAQTKKYTLKQARKELQK